ncbi:MAG: hypothetical protein PHP44_16000, partial [Kiritimatiellae bacterium]|nr:hypothetical protein [Kiritimatiellia bacterium]
MKKTGITALLVAVLCQGALANIIGNEGFEDAFGNWETDTVNWAPYNGSTGQSDWQKHDGSYSLILANFVGGSYDGTSSFAEQKPGVDAGTTYDINFYTFWDSGFVDNGASAYLKVFWDTAADPYNFGEAAQTYNLDLGIAESWKLQSFQITSGGTADNAKLEFGFTATGTGGSCYVDDVSMTAVPEPV